MATKRKQSTALPFPIIVTIGIVVICFLLIKLDIISIHIKKPAMRGDMPSSMEEKQTITPSPTPVALNHGKYTFEYSWGQGTTVPKMNAVTLDPNDPDVGATQNMQARFTHTAPISAITAEVWTDSTMKSYPLTLTSGTAENGVWSGSWKISESYLYRYIVTLKVTANGKELPYDVIQRGDLKDKQR